MIELKKRADKLLEELLPHAKQGYMTCHRICRLIKDQQDRIEALEKVSVERFDLMLSKQRRINELEAAIREHLEHPLMGSKDLKEVLGK